MSNYTIYHNPRCRKSRETLTLLQKNGIEPTIVEYLKTPLNQTELQKLEKLLDKPLSEFVRKNEAVYKEIKPEGNELYPVVASHPILLERPIVVKDDKEAVIGRPPENVLKLI